jgi:hypothetical protein
MKCITIVPDTNMNTGVRLQKSVMQRSDRWKERKTLLDISKAMAVSHDRFYTSGWIDGNNDFIRHILRIKFPIDVLCCENR